MKGKSLNKRLSNSKVRRQQHLLEVTVRADKARAMRYRAVFSFLFKTFFWLALLGGSVIGGKELLRRFVWDNPDYFVSDIRVSTGDLLQRDQILKSAGLREGMNIFDFDTKKARAALDVLPQIERAEIQRILPNRVDITITERRPIAWVTGSANENPTTSASAWLIDSRGVVMKPRQIVEQYHHLPQISGVQVANFAPGQKVMTVEMESALNLVQINTDNTHWQVRHIDLSKQWCMIVTDQNHAKITFGLDRVDEQVDRLFRYLDRAEAEQREIDTLNLMVVKFTPVTFRQVAADGEGDADHASNSGAGKDKEKDSTKSESSSSAKPSTPVPKATPVHTPTPSKGRTTNKSTSSKAQGVPANVRKPFRTN